VKTSHQLKGTNVNSIQQNLLQDNPQTEDGAEVQGCELGRELADCPLKKAGCGSLYSAVMYVMPPWFVRAYARENLGDEKEVQAWLQRLEDVTPGGKGRRL
jgi:hypothetical protein